jgi:phosphoglycolate phosphatase
MTHINSPPQNTFDLIIFDWDGTLYNSLASITASILAAANDLGTMVCWGKDSLRTTGMDMVKILEHIAPDLPADRRPEMIERFYWHYTQPENKNQLFDGIMDMLEALKEAKFLLAIATANGRSALDSVLQDTGLTGFFDATKTANDAQAKPHPEMLLDLMTEFGIPPQRTLMVGDMTFDLQMAINAGCEKIGVAYSGLQSSEALDVFQPLLLVDTVQELKNNLLMLRS